MANPEGAVRLLGTRRPRAVSVGGRGRVQAYHPFREHRTRPVSECLILVRCEYLQSHEDDLASSERLPDTGKYVKKRVDESLYV